MRLERSNHRLALYKGDQSNQITSKWHQTQSCYLEVIQHDACAEDVIVHTNQMGQRRVQDDPNPFLPQLQVLLLLFTVE